MCSFLCDCNKISFDNHWLSSYHCNLDKTESKGQKEVSVIEATKQIKMPLICILPLELASVIFQWTALSEVAFKQAFMSRMAGLLAGQLMNSVNLL